MNGAKFLSIVLSIATLATTANASQYGYGGEVYYTRQDVRCRNTGRSAFLGAVAGAGLGAGLGYLFGRSGTSTAIGGVAGGAGGALIGAGLSCRDRETYIEGVEARLSRRDYWNEQHSDNDHVRVYVLDSGYDRHNRVCRTYHSQFYTNRGWISKESTACYVNGAWEHGYPSGTIAVSRYRRSYPRSRVTYVHRDEHYYRPRLETYTYRPYYPVQAYAEVRFGGSYRRESPRYERHDHYQPRHEAPRYTAPPAD